MKIRKHDYTVLRNAIEAAMQEHSAHTIETYAAIGLSAKRYRWDLLNASHVRICQSHNASHNGDLALYDYMDDSHIDTALRRIVSHNNRNMVRAAVCVREYQSLYGEN